MNTCKLCGGPRESFQVFCGAACSEGWEMGQRPADSPKPDAERMARALAHMFLFSVHGHRPPLNEVARLTELFLTRDSLAEARGRDMGLEEAARECETQRDEETRPFTCNATVAARRIRALQSNKKETP